MFGTVFTICMCFSLNYIDLVVQSRERGHRMGRPRPTYCDLKTDEKVSTRPQQYTEDDINYEED